MRGSLRRLFRVEWWVANLKHLLFQAPHATFVVSSALFVIGALLDFAITNVLADGNASLEANYLARWWWETSGAFHLIEIPIYICVVVAAAFLAYQWSRFVALLWLNILGINHMLGFSTWLPGGGPLDVVYSLVSYNWAIGYALAVVSVCVSLPLALLEVALTPKRVSAGYKH